MNPAVPFPDLGREWTPLNKASQRTPLRVTAERAMLFVREHRPCVILQS